MLCTEDALHPPGPNSGSWSIFGEQNTDQTAGRIIRLSACDQAQKPISRSLCLSPNSLHFYVVHHYASPSANGLIRMR